jgi:hypothetical protein
MYNLFRFHTYSQRVYYDAIASITNDAFDVTNYEIFQDETASSYGNGTLYIRDPNLIIKELTNSKLGDTLTIVITMQFTNSNKEVISMNKEYPVVLEENGTTILSYDNTINSELTYASLKEASLTIQNNDQKVSYPLTIFNMNLIKSSNRESRMETASISGNVLRLGKLVTSYSLVNSYDYISLEYRYMKDTKGDKDDIDNYVVFDKVEAPTKEYMAINNNGTYIYEGEGSLVDKVLSVVVVLSDGDEDYIFSMEMEVDTSGVQYE